MHLVIKFCLALITMILSVLSLYGQNTSLSEIQKAFKQLSQNCVMNYSTTLKYDNGGIERNQGVLGLLGNKYYDSSANHFVFLNQKWFISADHSDKTIKVVDVSKLSKEFEDFRGMSMMNYMFESDTSIFRKMTIAFEKNGTNLMVCKLRNKSKLDLLQSLTITYNPVNYIPLEYSGEFLCPLEFETKIDPVSHTFKEIPISFAKLSFNVTNIKPAEEQLFNHKRLIEESKGKASILRYRNYETTYSPKTK